MQIIDLISLDYKNLLFDPIKLVTSCMYLVIGSKDIMGTFNFDFNSFQKRFLSSNGLFPIHLN